jgi:hypothetical protein
MSGKYPNTAKRRKESYLMDRNVMIDIASKELANNRHREDIIRKICSYGTMAWGDAEMLLAEAEQIHTPKGSLRTIAILLILGFVGIISMVSGFYLF